MTQMSAVPDFASVKEALTMLHAAMGYLIAADATAMAAETQAQALMALEQTDAMATAARISILGAFTAGRGYQADAAYSPRSWLMHQTRVTRGVASGHLAWVRRADGHPRFAAALAAGQVSESVARTVCGWTDHLPGEYLDEAEEILVTAIQADAGLRELAEILAKIFAKIPHSAAQDPDGNQPPDEDREPPDRSVRLETTFGGAGVLRGDLSSECAAAMTAVLDALSAPQGAEDTRSQAERCHDALHEALQRLLAADLVPGRAGQPAKVWAHVCLADLMVLEGSSALLADWSSRVRAQWAAARAGASIGGSDGAAWLAGEPAAAFTCDASITPVVTGDVNYAALADLVTLCAALAHLDQAEPDRAEPASSSAPPAPAAPGTRSREALENAIIGKAVDLLSGPTGLASFLRTGLLGARLAGPSLPLDVGISKDIPAGVRQAVLLRDRHCRWPGGCHQPAAACQVHHVRHRANGGPTSVTSCVLLCFFHHQVCIHRWGWILTLNPDGTTTAWNPGRTKILRSHGPPGPPGPPDPPASAS
jgi:hypothetical protein